MSSLSARATSNWSGNWEVWGWIIALWSLNSTLLLGASSEPPRYLAAFIANLLAALSLLLVLTAWRKILAALGPKNRFLYVLVAGAVLGTTKGLVTIVVFNAVQSEPIFPAVVMLHLISPCLFGMILTVSAGVFGAISDEYRQERRLLISSRVTQKMQSNLVHEVHPQLSALIQRTREALSSPSQESGNITNTLRIIAENDVRPLSHELWQAEASQIDSYRPIDLIRRAILAHDFVVPLLTPLLLFGLLSYQLQQSNKSQVIEMTVVQSLVTIVVLFWGKRLTTRNEAMSYAVFFGLPALAVALVELVTIVLFTQVPDESDLITLPFYYLIICLLSLALGVIAQARQSHDAIAAEIRAINSEQIESTSDVIVQQIQQRELAQFLHGYVQNYVLRASVRVEDDPASAMQVVADLEVMWQRIEAGTLPEKAPGPTLLSVLLSEHVATWEGIIDVSYLLECDCLIPAHSTVATDSLIGELIANAFRHGTASQVRITVRPSSNDLHLEVFDNGRNTRSSKTGLGTALLDNLTLQRWSRQSLRRPNGTLVTAQLQGLGITLVSR